MVSIFLGELNVALLSGAAAEAEMMLQLFDVLLYSYKEELPRLIRELSGAGEPEAGYVSGSRYDFGYFCFELHKNNPLLEVDSSIIWLDRINFAAERLIDW